MQRFTVWNHLVTLRSYMLKCSVGVDLRVCRLLSKHVAYARVHVTVRGEKGVSW